MTRRPATPLTFEGAVSLLREIEQDLDGQECTFRACRGPGRPESMITCSNCWTVYDIRRYLRRVDRRSQAVAS